MPSSQSRIPAFGSMNPAIEYQPRRAAYAVITDRRGRVAAVRASCGYFLPGGGSLTGETPEQTLAREVREELARLVRVVLPTGESVQYFYADERHYRMEAIFFAAEFVGATTDTAEHELHWLEAEEIERAFYHQCHTWAAGQI